MLGGGELASDCFVSQQKEGSLNCFHLHSKVQYLLKISKNYPIAIEVILSSIMVSMLATGPKG
jgi:hypothetical protein